MIQEFEAKILAMRTEREEAARQSDGATLALIYDKLRDVQIDIFNYFDANGEVILDAGIQTLSKLDDGERMYLGIVDIEHMVVDYKEISKEQFEIL
jgi:hypothetical protein